MNTLIETITYKGHDIEVHYDNDAESPGKWDNEDCFIVYNHKQFNVKRDGFNPEAIYEHITETKRNFYDGYYVFSLYAYIHSGVSLSVSNNSYPFTCGFDTSMAGFVLVKRQKGWSYNKKKAFERAKSLVDTWNLYLGGEVYGYDSEHGGCWGFYGDEGKEGMISQAKEEIDEFLHEQKKQHFETLKNWIRSKVSILYRKPFELVI